MPVCGSCKREIRVCDECGGLLCAPGCTDRLEDGCTCENDEEDDEDELEDEVDDEEE